MIEKPAGTGKTRQSSGQMAQGGACRGEMGNRGGEMNSGGGMGSRGGRQQKSDFQPDGLTSEQKKPL